MPFLVHSPKENVEAAEVSVDGGRPRLPSSATCEAMPALVTDSLTARTGSNAFQAH